MKATIEFRDPPEGYELVWDCNAIDGDMYPVKSGWARCDFSGRWFAILARRKRVGLVELLDTMQDCISSVSQWDRKKYDAAEGQLRARLAEIDKGQREPTYDEIEKWGNRHGVIQDWTHDEMSRAVMDAREIGQGGDK